MILPLPDPHDLVLCQIPGLGPAHLLALVDQWGDARGILAAPAAELRAAGISPAVVARIVAARRQVDQVAAGLKGLVRLAITPVPLLSPLYPERLRRSSDPPPVIYIQGSWPAAMTLVVVMAEGPVSAEHEPLVHDWLARLPSMGLTVGATGAAAALLPADGSLVALSYGLMLARQRLPPALRAAVQAGTATLISAAAINAPPDEATAAVAAAMLLALADGYVSLDALSSPLPPVVPHFLLAFKDRARPATGVNGKPLRADGGGARRLAAALGIHSTATTTVQQGRLL